MPLEIDREVFAFVLPLLYEQGLLKGTTLEANAAMTSIVRKDSGADWKTHRKNLAAAAEIELSWRADAARFDQQRAKTGKKKCSHDDWLSPSDPDGRITKLTAGSTDLADKANAVDLDMGLRTYISEPLVPQGRTWIDKAVEQRDAFRVNHCRIRSERGKRLLRRRGTVVERTFAYLCETGRGLRTWRRGLTKALVGCDGPPLRTLKPISHSQPDFPLFKITYSQTALATGSRRSHNDKIRRRQQAVI